MSEENYVKFSLCSSYNWPRLFRNLDKRPYRARKAILLTHIQDPWS